MNFHEEAFEGAVEIVAAAMEEAEVEISEKGGEQVGEFFRAIYKTLAAVATGEEDEKVRAGSFEMYEDAAGAYRFRLKAANGQIVAVSQGYGTKAACLKGIESVKRSAGGAEVKAVETAET